MSGQTVAEIGEFGLIAALQPRLKATAAVEVPAGDDAAVVRLGSDRVVVTTDMLVQDRHFRLDWSSPEDVGPQSRGPELRRPRGDGGAPDRAHGGDRDAAGRPQSNGSSGSSTGWWRRPLRWEQRLWVVMTRAPSITISITAWACPQDRGWWAATAPRPGICLPCGRLGWAAAGLAVLGRGFRSPRTVVDAHRRPQPPYSAGALAAAAGATSMIDVSDGLLADVGHIAELSWSASSSTPSNCRSTTRSAKPPRPSTPTRWAG